MHQWSCSALSHSFQPHSGFFWRDFIKKQKTIPKTFLCHLNIKFSWVRFPLWNGELFSEWSLYFQLEKKNNSKDSYRSFSHSFKKFSIFGNRMETINNKRRPLSTMFLIYNQLFPSYLKDITPGIRNSTFHINTRISSNYSLPRCRYEVFS